MDRADPSASYYDWLWQTAPRYPVLEHKPLHATSAAQPGDTTGSACQTHPKEYTASCLLMQKLYNSNFLASVVCRRKQTLTCILGGGASLTEKLPKFTASALIMTMDFWTRMDYSRCHICDFTYYVWLDSKVFVHFIFWCQDLMFKM